MTETWLWPIFGVIFVAGLFLDLFLFQRKTHEIPVREALKLVGFWVGIAAIFGVLVFVVEGTEHGLLFVTAYLTEYSLSIDNLFVFMVLFTYFAVPREAQRKVLLWGILGAILFRGIFIFAGIGLISRFHFLVYVLGAFLVYTAIKLITQKEKEVEPDKNPAVKFVRKFMPVASQYDGTRFFTRIEGARMATPLFIVLVAIETSDILFATDSVPAVLGITIDPLIVYSSNVLAILGLRSLFFALSGIFYLFRYLATGICAVLAFVGAKMLISFWYMIPTLVSLGIVLTLLIGSVLLSLIIPKKGETGE